MRIELDGLVRLLTTTLVKPAGPRCSAQVAWMTSLRWSLVGLSSPVTVLLPGRSFARSG